MAEAEKFGQVCLGLAYEALECTMLDEAFDEFNNSAFHLVLMLFLDFVSKYLYSNACK